MKQIKYIYIYIKHLYNITFHPLLTRLHCYKHHSASDKNSRFCFTACCATRYFRLGDCSEFDGNGSHLENTTCHFICGDILKGNITSANISEQSNTTQPVTSDGASFRSTSDAPTEGGTNLSAYPWTAVNTAHLSDWQSGIYENQSEILNGSRLTSPSEEYF